MIQTHSNRNNNRAEAISGFWNSYQRFSQHTALVNALVSQNPNIVSRVNLGTSYQGQTLIAARIGANQNSNKPVIWIEGGIHAREWISPATVTYFAQQLVDRYNSNDAVALDLLSYFDFYIVPVINVDGYEYTHTNVSIFTELIIVKIGAYLCSHRVDYGVKLGDQVLIPQAALVLTRIETLVLPGVALVPVQIPAPIPIEAILPSQSQK